MRRRVRAGKTINIRDILRLAVTGVVVAGSFSVATGIVRWYGTAAVQERVADAPYVLDDITLRAQANARMR